MKKQTIALAITILCIQQLHAQALKIEKEQWAEKPAISKPADKYSKESAVVVSDKRRVEYIDDANKEVAEYYTTHKIIHINDDRGIEGFNKIYLGITEKSEVVDVRARTILPGGKIIQLDKNNIKEIKDKEENTYKIFAMDGLEKGCDIEYFYTFKKNTSFFGREVIQGGVPVVESTVQIIGPKRLRFETKAFNSTVKPIDTVKDEKRILELTFKDTPGAEDEKYTYEDANLQRIEFKLSYNESGSKTERLYTWNEIARRIYGIYTDYTDKELKAIGDVVAKNGWDKLADEEAKIVAVENYAKKNISYNQDINTEDGNTLAHVIKDKTAGTIGIMRFYSAIYQAIGVKYQFVLTGNRDKFFIDREFENWNNCDFPVFYYPAENKFMAPTRPDYRYPWIFPAWGETNGLYCKHTSLGNFSTAIAEVKNIPLEDYTKTYGNIEAKLDFTTSLDSLNIDQKQSYAGYLSMNYRDAFTFSNADQRRDIIKELAKNYAGSENVLFSEILNQEFENEFDNKPLILHTRTRSGEMIEKAGNKLLLKIGMAIGPQVEMYQEKPRQNPVNMDYGHVEERKIEVVIPEGYKISNLNDIKIDQTYKDNGELTMGFVSDYELKGNVLTIHIMEQYRKTFYPLSQFDQFRKIINASSDFNKVVLVLEKKS